MKAVKDKAETVVFLVLSPINVGFMLGIISAEPHSRMENLLCAGLGLGLLIMVMLMLHIERFTRIR